MVNSAGEFPLSCRIIALVQERNRLFSYPLDHLAERIRETGFCCISCGACCTRIRNGHVFLLDRDAAAARSIDPSSLVPAPDPEFCDQNGTFYVSGYSLRTRGDAAGSCWFLRDGRCRIYPRRFMVCRTYPYMLRRVVDEQGTPDWRFIARLYQHGRSGHRIQPEECRRIALETREYENALLMHEITFLEFMRGYLLKEGLYHDPVQYARSLHRAAAGDPVTIMVYFDQGLEEQVVGAGGVGRMSSLSFC